MTDLVNLETEVRSIAIVQSVTDGDTTHAPSGDAVYEAISSIVNAEVIVVTNDKGTASASTMGKLYIEIGETTDIYYTTQSGSTYSWNKLETDIFDDVTIPADVSELTDTHNTAFTPKSHTHGWLNNDGSIGSSDNTSKNVVTDSSGKISLEAKYSHPSSKQCNYAYTHPNSKQCNYEYTHPTAKQCNAVIPDVTGKLDISQTSYKGKNVVVDSTTGNITFEDKYSHPSSKQCDYAYTHPTSKQCNATIPSDISDLSDSTGVIPTDVSDLTDTQNTPFTPKSHSHTISDLPTANTITNGDTTHIVSADVIYDYIDDIIGDADDWLTT